MEKFACPCCGYKTFDEEPNGTFNICEVCFWEDDNVQNTDPDYEGGANEVSLRKAQRNYQLFGASRKDLVKFVRTPIGEEKREINWKYLESVAVHKKET